MLEMALEVWILFAHKDICSTSALEISIICAKDKTQCGFGYPGTGVADGYMQRYYQRWLGLGSKSLTGSSFR